MENTQTPLDIRAASAAGDAPIPHKPASATRYLLLIRHGQATFNLDGRHPGQLPGIPLTDLGRRQALSAAVALSALELRVIISSPLERARETAEIVARGWALEVRTDPRLMDTDVGPWAGKKPSELKDDSAWQAFVKHPTEPPPGVESLAVVQARAMSVVEEVLHDKDCGNVIALVTHGDLVKLVLAHYLGISVECARFIAVSNASLTALAFTGEAKPEVLAVNWTSAPRWLSGPPASPVEAGTAVEPAPSALSAESIAEPEHGVS
jgi:probable phosphoglycerate mutase